MEPSSPNANQKKSEETIPRTLEEAQHEDFIWTWKSTSRNSKVSLWLPYFQGVKKKYRTKFWIIEYNGGSLILELDKIDFIMFYGATGELPLEFLDALASKKIPCMIHRRNIPSPYIFYPAPLSDDVDILTRQILVREHSQKKAYVAKTLIRHRFDKFQSHIAISRSTYRTLASYNSVKEVRQLEACESFRYWQAWFEQLGLEEETRRAESPITTALDAGSKFLYGILLRWILFHKFSPQHGYLHEPASYPSLVYDLMEPYRYIIEEAASQAWLKQKEDTMNEKRLVVATLAIMKEKLDETVYVPATRQYVRRKNLLHGIVLALRAYLLNESLRLVIPVEGEKKGGRPIKTGYKLPGETHAGKRKGAI